MPSKSLSAVLLVCAVVLDAAVLVFVSGPGERLAFGLLVLVPVILMASALDLTQRLAQAVGLKPRIRRYAAMRSSIDAFLDDARRLNWLVVDAKLGFEDEERVAGEIEGCRRRMQARVEEIVRHAGEGVATRGAAPEEVSPPPEAGPETA